MDKKFDKEVREAIGKDVAVDKTPALERSPNQLVANVTGVVDGKVQPLLNKGEFHGASIPHIPGAPKEVNDVLAMLVQCLKQNKHVQEGLIGDVLWGFQQVGYDPLNTYTGLAGLEKLGFIKFQAPDNAYVSLDSDQAGKAWIRYQPKFYAMLYNPMKG